MLAPVDSSQFRRDIKRAKRQGLKLEKLQAVIATLFVEQPLPPQYRDHSLYGSWKDYRECHIEPDWLLMYRVITDELHLVRTCSHSDLFG